MSLFTLLSRLLEYPQERPAAGDAPLPPGPAGRAVERFLAETDGLELEELRRRYVATFDFDRRANLYLTYHLYGDQRRRGVELVRLKRRFREAGLELAPDQLPDYLPVLLEFAELAPEAGREALAALRGPVELVRAALAERGSPYAHLLDAVALTLPPLSRRQAEAVERLAAEGPPSELVGLDSFTPPELEPFLARERP
ncbi:MAG TPA: nitrate reductase molybdenum cofactor assembly chaperone [Gaiellaceae bacterium]|nr:nitrate reductase molybdenum cofactor assembly chaperone [Gaiellaceae bacterium]